MKTSEGEILAFDTSCYTTSVAVVSKHRVVHDQRIMLSVPKGNRGMRQSEAVFHHVKNLQQHFLDYSKQHFNIKAVAYSANPCPKHGSYMPAFCVGESYAITCASVIGAKLYAHTHQHGHIYSAFFGNTIDNGTYCAFHMSDGTLDILRVEIEDR